METDINKLKDSRAYSLIFLYDMQTDYFLKAIDGIADQDTHKRLDTKSNHIAWLAGSLVEQRFELDTLFGGSSVSSAHHLFKNNQGIIDDTVYPSLQVYKTDWEKISGPLRNKLINADKEDFDKSFEMPGMKITHFELFCFMIYREANCIGQIALWRRFLGYEPMKYM